ncbi:MAG: 7,8-dihydro-8-oxoguanine triphosphatase [Propionibacterium sp.]|nr:MAG: 7,8-dihydro-8-oxoguanine triphosphatase [Propionibacterium sp.]
MKYCPVLTTLAFIVRDDQVLLVHRLRAGDEQEGKFNGLGGKIHPDEDVITGLHRELAEEAGIVPISIKFRGTVSWPGFSADGGDVLGFIFIIDDWNGEIFQSSEEGPLSWHPISELAELPMWEGDRYFLPLVFDPEINQFHGVLPYENNQPKSWQVSVI